MPHLRFSGGFRRWPQGNAAEFQPYITPDWPAHGSKIYYTKTSMESDFDIVEATWVLDSLPSGDYDGSGVVEQADLDIVLLNWGEPVTGRLLREAGWTNDNPTAPVVDQEELDKVLLNWGTSVFAVVGVPEPGTAVLGVFGFAIALLVAKPAGRIRR